MEDKPKIIVEETNLEDLIILGDDKLIDCTIEYPTKEGTIIKAKTKIKQLTIKEIKNLPLNKKLDITVIIKVLKKSLFTQDETPFTEELISSLPIGVATMITEKILELSGVKTEENKEVDMGF